MFEANKKQAPLKSYPLKIRLDSVNQTLKDKEKVTDQTESPTGRFHVYTHSNWGHQARRDNSFVSMCIWWIYTDTEQPQEKETS